MFFLLLFSFVIIDNGKRLLKKQTSSLFVIMRHLQKVFVWGGFSKSSTGGENWGGFKRCHDDEIEEFHTFLKIKVVTLC